MLFLTVGTQFPFDRLVKAVDKIAGNGLLNNEQIFAQIGASSYHPQNFESVKYVTKEHFGEFVKSASAIIGHAGMGTIMTALDNEKPLLVMPRLKKYGEVVNNHQIDIAKKFAELDHLLVAYDVSDLPYKIHELKSFTPTKRNANPDMVADRIRRFLNTLNQSH
jgi:UDP-N-acetylglucosamine transferase subunit ALG13